MSKNKTENISAKIISKYLIHNTHDMKSIGGLLISGIISTFGVYGLIAPFFTTDGVLSSKIYTALIAFVIVLIIFDGIKRGAFTKWLNSILKEIILAKKRAVSYLVITIFSTFFLISLDALGSWTTAELGANLYQQSKTNNSTEYKILEQNAESGKDSTMVYITMTNNWRADEKQAQIECNNKWRVPKYRTKNGQCMDKWRASNTKPSKDMMNAPSAINIADYRAIQDSKKGFLDEYLQTILFVLLSLLTLLMQYLTISKIFDDYKDIDDSLTDDKIEFINDDIAEHEQIQAEHEQEVAEMMAESTKTKKGLDKEFNRVGEAIGITHKQKRNDTRAKTVYRIANNKYVPQEQSKAGKVINPFYGHEKEKKDKLQWIGYADETTAGHLIEHGITNVLNAKKMIDKEGAIYYTIDKFWFYSVIQDSFKLQDLQDDINRMLSDSVKPNSYNHSVNQTVKPMEEKEPKNEGANSSVNQTVITERLTDRLDSSFFSSEELKLITILWDGNNVKPHDSLVTRKEVLKVIGDTKINTVLLRNLYKKLQGYDYIYKRVGYFAKVGV